MILKIGVGIAGSEWDARTFPAFDISDEPWSHIRAEVCDAVEIELEVDASVTGADSAVLNLLVGLGGAHYGHRGRSSILRKKQVSVTVNGLVGHRARAIRQLKRVLQALGGDDVCFMEVEPQSVSSNVKERTPTQHLDPALGQIVLENSAHVEESLAAQQAVPQDYGNPRGDADLLSHLYSLRGPSDNRAITITGGASLGLMAALVAIVRRPGPILIPVPGYPAYRSMLEQLGYSTIDYGVPSIDFKDLDAKFARAAAIIWNDPHNPTGSVAPADVVERIAFACTAADVLLISDEVYRGLEWSVATTAPAEVGAQNTCVSVDSFSKRFAAASLRVGWVSAPKQLVGKIARAHWRVSMGASSITQNAAVHLLENSETIQTRVRSHLDSAWRSVEEVVKPAHRPDAGPFLWIPSQNVNQDSRFATPGRAFGGDNTYVRISVGGPPDLLPELLRDLVPTNGEE